MNDEALERVKADHPADPEITLTVGVKEDKVVVILEITEPKTSVAINYTPDEAAAIAMSIVQCAQRCKPVASPIVLPGGKA